MKFNSIFRSKVSITLLIISYIFLSLGDRIFQFFTIFFVFDKHPNLIVLMTVSLLIGNLLAFPLFKVLRSQFGDHKLFLVSLFVKMICYLIIPFLFKHHVYFSFVVLAIESFMDIITLPYIYSFVDKKIKSSFYGIAAKIDLVDRLTLISSPWITVILINSLSEITIGILASICVLISATYFIQQKTEKVEAVSEVKGIKSVWKNKLNLNKEIKSLIIISILTGLATSSLLDVILPAIAIMNDSNTNLVKFASLEFVISITFILANLILIKIKPRNIYLFLSILLMAFSYFIMLFDFYLLKVFSLVMMGFFYTMYKLNSLNLYKFNTPSEKLTEVLLLRSSILFIVTSVARLFASILVSINNKADYVLIINIFILIITSIYVYRLFGLKMLSKRNRMTQLK